MADAKNLKQARAVYSTLCEMLDDRSWHYNKDEEKLTISCGVRGDNMPISIRMKIDADRLLVMLFSQIDIEVPEDVRIEMALAVTKVNYKLVNGCFDYSPAKGNLLFRLVSSVKDSLIGPDLLAYVLDVSCGTVDDYNHLFKKLADKEITLAEFFETVDE